MKAIKYIFWIAFVLIISCDSTNGIEEPEGPEEPGINIPDPVSQSRSQKRGVSFNFDTARDIDLLAKGISWSYNWAPDQIQGYDKPFQSYEIDFCPMAWDGIDANKLRAYKVRNPQCKYLLAFNEPNLTNQSNMTPSEAAEKWNEVKAIATELGLKVISPAMNYGTLPGYGDPIVWLDEFFQLVPLSEFEGIAIHCYMSWPSATKSYIERFKKYGKPIWMTEICAFEGKLTPEVQMKYLSDIVNYMESDPIVARYAWFIPRGDEQVNDYPYMFLLNKAQPAGLTPLGEVFVNMSSLDKSIYYVQGQIIEAEHYAANIISEGVGKEGWVDGPSLQPTTDSKGGTLELVNFTKDMWVEYQVEMFQTENHDLQLRYAAALDSKVSVKLDGTEVAIVALPATGLTENVWNTMSRQIPMETGKHTLRMEVIQGRICLNWLKIGIK